jgi:hypothetical protein
VILKGIVHCHSTFSYDGKMSVPELCAMLRREGFDFVALTEHTQGVTADDYARLIRTCAEESNEKFTAIPGVEVRCGKGIEIAGIGVRQVPEEAQPEKVVSRIRELGGFALWVHPFKQGRWRGPFLDCDAVEVMNGKLDGALAPNLDVLRTVKRAQRAGKRFHAIFGMDFHEPWQPRAVWVECDVREPNADAIVAALRDGHFISRIRFGAMSSSGEIAMPAYTLMLLMRFAYFSWGATLKAVPPWLRRLLISASRPMVRIFKRGGH